MEEKPRSNSNELDQKDDSSSALLQTEEERRRRFLINCGKFAAGAPPAVAMLLSASEAKAQQFSLGFLCSFFPFLPFCPGAGQGNAQGLDESQEMQLREDIKRYYEERGYKKD